VSRGIKPQQLENNSLWWQGPEWLKNPESDWSVNEPRKAKSHFKQDLSVNAAVFVPMGKISTPVVWSLLSEVYPLGEAI